MGQAAPGAGGGAARVDAQDRGAEQPREGQGPRAEQGQDHQQRAPRVREGGVGGVGGAPREGAPAAGGLDGHDPGGDVRRRAGALL